MKLTYHLRVVCIAKGPDGSVIAQSSVEVKHETYESLAAAAREAKRLCQEHQPPA
jgi:hypothetical protein